MSQIPGTEGFYQNLPIQQHFEALAGSGCHARVPADWRLILTDVRDSTRAIRDGAYKEVNTLGAASIAAARRALGAFEFPFAFGGDGATILVPESRAGRVLEALAGLRDLARERFGMDLRVGSVRVGELEDLGAPVEVAKYGISEHCRVASLRGEGLRVAEQRIKSAAAPDPERPPRRAEPDLSGLSCRWKPFPTRRGKIVALIIEARGDGESDPSVTFSRVIQGLDRIFPDGIDRANPAEIGLQGYRSLGENLRAELRHQRSAWSVSFVQRLAETLLATVVFGLRLPIPTLTRYRRDTPGHCDFRKFDHSLRAVLDCSLDQVRAIERMLDDEQRAGTLHYGLHQSDQSLMTCLVEGLGPGQHLHFIDAAGGGYAIAATHLKRHRGQICNIDK